MPQICTIFMDGCIYIIITFVRVLNEQSCRQRATASNKLPIYKGRNIYIYILHQAKDWTCATKKERAGHRAQSDLPRKPVIFAKFRACHRSNNCFVALVISWQHFTLSAVPFNTRARASARLPLPRHLFLKLSQRVLNISYFRLKADKLWVETAAWNFGNSPLRDRCDCAVLPEQS